VRPFFGFKKVKFQKALNNDTPLKKSCTTSDRECYNLITALCQQYGFEKEELRHYDYTKINAARKAALAKDSRMGNNVNHKAHR